MAECPWHKSCTKSGIWVIFELLNHESQKNGAFPNTYFKVINCIVMWDLPASPKRTTLTSWASFFSIFEIGLYLLNKCKIYKFYLVFTLKINF